MSSEALKLAWKGWAREKELQFREEESVQERRPGGNQTAGQATRVEGVRGLLMKAQWEWTVKDMSGVAAKKGRPGARVVCGLQQ